MNRSRTILWDVGGTLVDFACSLPDSVRGRLAGCDVDHSRLSDDHIEATYIHFLADEQNWLTDADERAAERKWFEALLKPADLRGEAIDRVAEQIPRYFDLYRPVDGILQLLSELRHRNVPMAIVSNWPPSLPGFLSHHGIAEYFNPIVYSAQDGIHKPDPRIFLRALEAIKTRPQDAVFIGDNPLLDIAPAKVLGMRTIHFDPRRRVPFSNASDTTVLRQLLLDFLDE